MSLSCRKRENMEFLKKAGRIGVIGGAFDPIHYGHLTAAECVRRELNLDLCLFIPTGRPPHKGKITFKEHRYLMTALACEDNPHFYTSRMELERPGASYTVDTLHLLKEMTNAEIFFIVGADEMLQISAWKDADLLPGLCRWVTVTRPGYNIDKATQIPGLDISGTELRKRAALNQSIKYLVPPPVERYIRDLNLYRKNYECYEKTHQAVAAQLSEERYRHTMGVMETSILLAARYDVNLRKAYLAALLHDYAKELKEDEKRQMCRDFAIPVDPVQDNFINLMHGHLSAELAKRKFNIDDPEILNAIKYHTTGRAGMGPLDMVVKIADNVEPNRTYYPTLKQIRLLSAVNLKDACIAAIKWDIEYTKSKGRTIHQLGIEALKDLEQNKVLI